LKNDKLAMSHENTTFTLVHYWLESREGWTTEEKQQAFNSILQSDALRFHHMDFNYLAIFAFRSPWMLRSSQGMDILHRAVLVRAGCEAREMVEVPLNRSQLKDHHHLEASVPKVVCCGLQDKQDTRCFLGLLRGLPIYLNIGRRVDENGIRTFGLYVGWSSGGLPMSGKRSQEVAPAVSMGIGVRVAPDHRWESLQNKPFKEDQAWGWPSFLTRWEEVTGPTSNRFVDGVMKVHVRFNMSL